MKLKKMYLMIISSLIFAGCTSVKDLENDVNEEDFLESNAATIEEEEEKNEAEMKGYFITEEAKIQDVQDTIVYVDRPVYVPQEERVPSMEKNHKTGYDAAVEAQKGAIIKPEEYNQGTFYYTFNENLVYEIYAQPYHLTDVILEKGEVVIGTPLLSEDESAWELTAGVAKDPVTEEDIQHLFVKPAYSNQDSSMIIITDRRVYHFRLKSYASTHMAMVKFKYPHKIDRWAQKPQEKDKEIESDFVRITNPEFLSFDYQIKYSMFRKPEFLPQRVYDDGALTYIQVDDIVLHKKLPVIFNEKNEIVNYQVKRNIFIIPRLINKVTLRLGKEKVTITKKKSTVNETEHSPKSETEEELNNGK